MASEEAVSSRHPVTATVAAGARRRAIRTAWRDFRSATWVTEQVLIMTASAAAGRSRTVQPASRRREAIASESARFSLQPRVMREAVGAGSDITTVRGRLPPSNHRVCRTPVNVSAPIRIAELRPVPFVSAGPEDKIMQPVEQEPRTTSR